MTRWTEEMIEYLREVVPGRPEEEAYRLFCERFPVTVYSFGCAKNRFKLHNGLKGGQFPKGHIPKNKGIKGIHNSVKTEFKKGHQPANTRQLNDIKIDREGYHYIKVSMTGKACERWTQMGIYVWEHETGETVNRRKEVVIFLNGKRGDYRFENLKKIPRSIHAIMCHNGWYTEDPELTQSYINIATVQHQQNFLMRKHRIGVYRFESQQKNSKAFNEWLENQKKGEND